MGLGFWNITFGNVLTCIVVVIAAINFWRAKKSSDEAQIAYKRDLEWRIMNLETWRKEHMVDADARDKLLTRLDKMCDHLEYLVSERRRENEGMRRRREGQ